MSFVSSSPSAPHAHPEDDRALMARMAGLLWLTTASVTLVGQALPGAPREHLTAVVALFIPVALHGLACVLGLKWTQASLREHFVCSLALFPLIAVALWATGGASSYIVPMIVLAAIWCAYFFPPAWAAVLLVEIIAVSATPLLYDPGAVAQDHYPATLLALAAACVSIATAVVHLKARLVRAERRQRQMANLDPLTGLANRRAFDAAATAALARGREFALVFVDLNDFKAVNDDFGHPFGDRVLREVARRTASVVREEDCLARVGGDEFALVACGTGSAGADRLRAELAAAISEVPASPPEAPAARMSAVVASAVFPGDGETLTDVVRVADRALHAQKRQRRAVRALDLGAYSSRRPAMGTSSPSPAVEMWPGTSASGARSTDPSEP